MELFEKQKQQKAENFVGGNSNIYNKYQSTYSNYLVQTPTSVRTLSVNELSSQSINQQFSTFISQQEQSPSIVNPRNISKIFNPNFNKHHINIHKEQYDELSGKTSKNNNLKCISESNLSHENYNILQTNSKNTQIHSINTLAKCLKRLSPEILFDDLIPDIKRSLNTDSEVKNTPQISLSKDEDRKDLNETNISLKSFSMNAIPSFSQSLCHYAKLEDVSNISKNAIHFENAYNKKINEQFLLPSRICNFTFNIENQKILEYNQRKI